jgi:hypothetical protein
MFNCGPKGCQAQSARGHCVGIARLLFDKERLYFWGHFGLSSTP